MSEVSEKSSASESANKSSSTFKPSTEPIWLGIGSPQPQSRQLNNTLFGHVSDAFDSKSIKIGEESPFDRRKRLAEEAAVAAEVDRKRKEEEEQAAAAMSKETSENEAIDVTEENMKSELS